MPSRRTSWQHLSGVIVLSVCGTIAGCAGWWGAHGGEVLHDVKVACEVIHIPAVDTFCLVEEEILSLLKTLRIAEAKHQDASFSLVRDGKTLTVVIPFDTIQAAKIALSKGLLRGYAHEASPPASASASSSARLPPMTMPAAPPVPVPGLLAEFETSTAGATALGLGTGLGDCSDCPVPLPSSANANDLLDGKPGAIPLGVVYTAGRMAIIGGGLLVAGFRGKELLKGAVAGGLAIEAFVLMYTAFTKKKASP